MRGVELTIAIGSTLGLLLMMVADAAQQRTAVATPSPATSISIEHEAITPALTPVSCVPGDDFCAATPVVDTSKSG